MITTIIAIIFLCLWVIEYNNFLLWADKFVERKYEGESQPFLFYFSDL